MAGSLVSLPPKPDADGDPRPPAAPPVTGPWQGRFAVSGIHFAGGQRWFLGMGLPGPMLESAVARRPNRWRHAATGALLGIALPVILIGGVTLLTVGEPSRVVWVIGVVAASVYLLFFVQLAFTDSAYQRLDANAQSLDEWTTSDAPGPHVDLYELASITIVDTGRAGLALRLVGREHGRLTAPCGLLEGNQQLWDLVYNGLRHSAANGAALDSKTRQLLDLPFNDPF